MQNYKEQLKRTERYLVRMRNLYGGKVPLYKPGADRVDDVYSFFLHCYHVKDWLKNDEGFSGCDGRAIEDYVTNTPSLALVADICNGLKHMRIKGKPRSVDMPTTRLPTVDIQVGPGILEGRPDLRIKTRVVIKHRDKEIDALELATEAVKAWKTLLAEAS
jgi:hypothetical protein